MTQPQPLTADREQQIRTLDLLALMPERSAAVVSGHLAALLAEVHRLRASEADGWTKAHGYNQRWVETDDALTDERLLTRRLRNELSRQGRAYKAEIQHLKAELGNQHAAPRRGGYFEELDRSVAAGTAWTCRCGCDNPGLWDVCQECQQPAARP